MSFYNQREFSQYNNYRPITRRNSNSFNEGESGPKRKKWNKRGGYTGGSPRNVEPVSPQPLFKEPLPPPRRSPAQSRVRENIQRNGPSPSRPQLYFDMKDMPRFVDPEHAGRPWYWDNYTQNCKNWQDRHKLSYYKSRCLALEFENQMLYEQVKSLMEEHCIFSAERGEMPKMRLPDMPDACELLDGGTSRSSYKKPTPKHNQEKQRNEEGDKKKTDETFKKSVQKEGPKHPVGLKRKEDLDLLYGKNSSLIHKLETAVQLNYNRNCDTFKPELWLAAPLNQETKVGAA